jgi:hypothetical protein
VNANGDGIADDNDDALNDSGLVRKVDCSVVEDRLYATGLLKDPGTVVLHSGTTQQSFALPAGVSEVSMPFAAVTQSIELQRGGTTVLTAQTATPVRFNSNERGRQHFGATSDRHRGQTSEHLWCTLRRLCQQVTLRPAVCCAKRYLYEGCV